MYSMTSSHWLGRDRSLKYSVVKMPSCFSFFICIFLLLSILVLSHASNYIAHYSLYHNPHGSLLSLSYPQCATLAQATILRSSGYALPKRGLMRPRSINVHLLYSRSWANECAIRQKPVYFKIYRMRDCTITSYNCTAGPQGQANPKHVTQPVLVVWNLPQRLDSCRSFSRATLLLLTLPIIRALLVLLILLILLSMLLTMLTQGSTGPNRHQLEVLLILELCSPRTMIDLIKERCVGVKQEH